MLFDVITALVLFKGFGVLSRLIGRRRGDVLDYIPKPDARWGSQSWVRPSTIRPPRGSPVPKWTF